jgi:hypothetical protein
MVLRKGIIMVKAKSELSDVIATDDDEVVHFLCNIADADDLERFFKKSFAWMVFMPCGSMNPNDEGEKEGNWVAIHDADFPNSVGYIYDPD